VEPHTAACAEIEEAHDAIVTEIMSNMKRARSSGIFGVTRILGLYVLISKYTFTYDLQFLQLQLQ